MSQVIDEEKATTLANYFIPNLASTALSSVSDKKHVQARSHKRFKQCNLYVYPNCPE